MGNVIKVDVSRTKAIESGLAAWGLLEVDAARVLAEISASERAAFAEMVGGRHAKEGVVCGTCTRGDLQWSWIYGSADPREVAAAVRSFAAWQADMPKLRAQREAEERARRLTDATERLRSVPQMARGQGCRNAIERFFNAAEDLGELGVSVESVACVEGDAPPDRYWLELGDAVAAGLAADLSSRWISNDRILAWETDAKTKVGGRAEIVLGGAMREAMRQRAKMDEEQAARLRAELAEKTARLEAGTRALEEWAREHAATRFAAALDEGYPCASEIDDVVIERMKDEIELCFGPDVIFDECEFSPRLELAKNRSAPTPEVLGAAKALGDIVRQFKAPAGYKLSLTRVIRVEVSSDRHEGPLTGVGIIVACPMWSKRSWFVSLEIVPETAEEAES